MENEYSKFLEQPTRESYLRVRKLVLANAINHDALRNLIELIKSQQYDAAIDLQDEMGATWLLSPSFHLWSAKLAECVGDADAKELENFQSHACISGLLATGDGSCESPFSVTYTSDARDLLEFFGTDSIAQRTIQKPNGVFDLITAADGRQWYFARAELTKAQRAQQSLLRNATLAN